MIEIDPHYQRTGIDPALTGALATHAAGLGLERTVAWICGTPKLVVMRVVQPPPGPMPTLTASAPRSARKVAPAAVAT